MNQPRNSKINYNGCDYMFARKLKNSKYFEIAADVAKKSSMIQKHGCIIVYKNKIISSAYNIMPMKYKDSVHAEINAISKIKHLQHLFKDCELYIVRIGQNSMEYPLKYSKPCQHCANFIVSKQIRKVYYSINYEFDSFCPHSAPESNE
jgi:deoxycytidylate deaminase